MPSDLEVSDSSIIRTGRDGRSAYSRAQRQNLLDAYDRSGLSAMSFSGQHGVRYQTFIAWLRKRRQNSGVDRSWRACFRGGLPGWPGSATCCRACAFLYPAAR